MSDPRKEGRRLPIEERNRLARRIIAGELSLDEAAAAHWVSVAVLERWIVEYVLDARHEPGRDFKREQSFWGRIDDLRPVDLMLLAAEGRKTCRLRFESDGAVGRVWMERGRIVDAELESTSGDQALVAVLHFESGGFGIVFTHGQRLATVEQDTLTLLTAFRRQSERRADLLAKLEPLDRMLVAVPGRTRRGLDPESRELLDLFDGQNSLRDVVELSRHDELETLEALAQLMSAGALEDAPRGPHRALAGEASLPPAAAAPKPAVVVPSPGPSRLVIGGMIGLAVFAWIGLTSLEFFEQGDEAQALAQAPAADEAPREPVVTRTSSAPEPEVEPEPKPPPSPCPEGMVHIEGGRYFMGSDSERPAMHLATPAHKVEVDAFCIDRDEATVKRYRKCSDVGECERAHRKSYWPRGSTPREQWLAARRVHAPLCNEGAEGREDHPVNCVTFKQAASFCAWEGKRLPSEAEWEFAARGRDGRVYPWGDEAPSPERANVCGQECVQWREEVGLDPVPPMFESDDGFAGTAPIGSFPAGTTPTGIRDIVGNLFEWTEDRFYEYSDDGTAVLVNPTGPDHGARRIIRGGAFNSFMPEFTDPALRFPMDEEAFTHGIGFRCAAAPRFDPKRP